MQNRGYDTINSSKNLNEFKGFDFSQVLKPDNTPLLRIPF